MVLLLFFLPLVVIRRYAVRAHVWAVAVLSKILLIVFPFWSVLMFLVGFLLY